MNLAQVELILVGPFTVAGAILGWDWFIEHWKSSLFVSTLAIFDKEKLGRQG